MYMRNQSWIEGILLLDNSFKSKRCNKVCHDVHQAHRLTLTNKIVLMKSVKHLWSETKEEDGSIK
jgi:hypothetical protein